MALTGSSIWRRVEHTPRVKVEQTARSDQTEALSAAALEKPGRESSLAGDAAPAAHLGEFAAREQLARDPGQEFLTRVQLRQGATRQGAATQRAGKVEQRGPRLRPNLGHLNFLGEWGQLGGARVHYTWIYADQVDGGFRRMQADNMGHVEGKTCVDDVARAALVYLDEAASAGGTDSLARARGSLEFILGLQADDGEFFNFVYLDNTRNEKGVTSYKSHGWWGVRALWAMARGLRVFEQRDPALCARMRSSIERLLPHLDQELSAQLKGAGGKPGAQGAGPASPPPGLIEGDSAVTSTAALGLTELLRADPGNKTAARLLATMCDAMAAYQDTTPGDATFGAHYSHPDEHWHGWGNRQTWALAEAAKVLHDHPHRGQWIGSARLEADAFFARLLATHIPRAIHEGETQDYDQIAYAVGSMVSGLAALHEVTGEERFKGLATIAGSWFYGNNPVGRPVYDEVRGVGLDGIRGPGDISDNAGAESTIEALLAIQALGRIGVERGELELKRVQTQPGMARFEGSGGAALELRYRDDGAPSELRESATTR